MPPKNSLGKGLGAIFSDLLDDVTQKPSFVLCGIEELVPNRYQPRKDFNLQDQKRLVASIKKSGIIQPIIVRKFGTGYEIIAGERRWRAAQAAGFKEVPIIIRDVEDLAVVELSLIENIQRENLNPIEEAHAYATLSSKFGLSQDEISANVGKDRSTIANTIRLLKLSDMAKNAIIEKKISSGHARALLSLESPEEQEHLLKLIIEKNLSVRETEALIHKKKSFSIKKDKKKKKNDVYTTDLERSLSAVLMTEVHIIHGNNKGSINIRFSTKEDFHRLVSMLMDIKMD
jgi:ParB family chromosome partitioning protein